MMYSQSIINNPRLFSVMICDVNTMNLQNFKRRVKTQSLQTDLKALKMRPSNVNVFVFRWMSLRAYQLRLDSEVALQR